MDKDKKHTLFSIRVPRAVKGFIGYVVAPAIFVACGVFATLNHLTVSQTTVIASHMTELMERYGDIEFNEETMKPDLEDLASFQEYVYHTPAGDHALGWLLLDSLTFAAHGYGDDNEKVLRQALNRLQGHDLAFIIKSLDTRVKGFRSPGYVDMLAVEDAGYSEAMIKTIKGRKDVYTFTESELAALNHCAAVFTEMRERSIPVISDMQWAYENVLPFLIYNECSLTGKIAL